MKLSTSITGSSHPAYALSLICLTGGGIGFIKRGSKISLASGLALSSIYFIGARRISKGQTYGLESALVASVILTVSSLMRINKPTNVPKILSVLGLTSTIYFSKKA
ncbi:yjr085c-like protein [Phakopsora pachyrhizi]|uniref:Yjr085c-like protein n=1 Tax=Phakopsora pachyrhizi TaxID=170000 RepID=A0AAV0B1D3_PHAPC|nr:yjr085c-like protein [Phakopsora pachyrhizi]